jgi:general secretion pathway protein B
MSYILDALKKSEKERQKSTVPDPLQIHDYIAHEAKNRRPVWVYVLSVVVILNIGLLFYWMNPWQTKKAATSNTSSGERSIALNSPAPPAPVQPKNDSEKAVIAEKEKEPESARTFAVKAPQSAPLAGKGGTLQAAAASSEKVKEKPVHSGESMKSQATTANEPQHVAQTAPVPSDHKTETQTPAPDANRIYTVSELPLSLQQSLPAFTISAFLYSDDPAARMVRVNGKMLREGDALPEGLKLNEIRQDELIFGYQNYRIRLRVQ